MIGIYIRVSTDKQAFRGHSAHEQKSKSIKYIQETYGLEQPYMVYDDSGFSGKNFNRPGMKEMLQDMLSEKITEVVFLSIDRISRDLLKMSYFIEHAKENQVKLTCLTSDVSTDTPEKVLLVMMQSLFAQYERDKISQRTKIGIQGGLRKGIYTIGGKVPFGYYKIGKDLAVNVAEANEITKLFNLFFYKEMSVNSLIEYYKKNPYTKIAPKSIPTILRNKLYCGKKIYNDEEFNVAPAIINQELFDNVQKILEQKKRVRVNKYLFAGKLFCNECGIALTSVSTNKKEKTYLYYMCNNPKCSCNKLRVAEQKLLTVTSPMLEQLLKEKVELYNQKPLNQRLIEDNLKNIQREIKKLNEKKNVASNYLIDKILSPSEYQKQINQIEKHITFLKYEYKLQESNLPSQKSFFELNRNEKITFIKSHFPTLPVDLKRKKLKTS